MNKPIPIKDKPWPADRTHFDRNLAVVIGIDRYENPNIHHLSTPVSDANALADLLEKGYGYKPENVLRLVDEQANLNGLRTLLTDTLPKQLKPTESDRLIFYFAGHGLPKNSEEGPTGYLVPQDAQPNREDSFLSMKEVYDALSQLQCHHLLVILDCCFAGTFRWAGSRKLIAELETIHREHYDRFIRFPAWQVITSSAHDQEALDFVKLSEDIRGQVDVDNKKHSPFALALLEALQNSEPDSQGRRYQNADYTQDGVIVAHELIVYLSDCVSKLSQERQAPGLYPLKREYDKGEFIFVQPDFDPRQLLPAPELNEENNPYRGLKPFEERHAQFFFGRQKLVEELSDRLAQSRRPLTVVLGISGSGKSSLVKAGLIPNFRQASAPEIFELNLIQAWMITEAILASFSQFPLKLLPICYIHQYYILTPMRPGESPFLELAKAVLPVAHSHLIDRLAQVSFLDTTMAAILDSKSPQKSKADTQEQPSSEKALEVTKLAQLWHTASPEAKLLLIVDYFQQLQSFCHQSQEQAELSQLHEEINNALKPLAQTLQQNPESFGEAIAQWSQDHPQTKILLVIDQLEELITMSQEDRESENQSDSREQKEWQRFLSLLRVTLAKYRQQLHVVVTLRSDFEPRFLNSALKAHWKDARFPVRGMNSDELRDAIEGPALKQALYFEPSELVGKLIDEVGQMPGALPLLSFTLSELYIKLYERWTKDKSIDRALRIKDYEELGGVAGALTRRATQEYEALDTQHRGTMRRVMLRMVAIEGGGAARRRVPVSELVYPDPEENKRVALVSDRLVKARLLVKGQETGESYGELAHDFLVRGWSKLREWIDRVEKASNSLSLQQRLTMTAAAYDWDKNQQEENYLWNSNPYLTLLEEMVNSDEGWLNQLEINFVGGSIRKRDEEDIKEKKQTIRILNRTAEILLTSDQELEALIEAIKAGKQIKNLKDKYSFWEDSKLYAQVLQTLQKAFYQAKERNIIKISGEADLAVFSPNDQQLAIVTDDGTVSLWERTGKQFPGSKPFNVGGQVWSVSFSPDSQQIITVSTEEVVKWWTLKGQQAEKGSKQPGSINQVILGSNGRLMIFSDNKLRDLESGSQLAEFPNEGIGYDKFSPDGKLIATGVAGDTISIWNIDPRNPIVDIKDFPFFNSNIPVSISFSPNSKLIAAAGFQDDTIYLWDLKGNQLAKFKANQNGIKDISFSHDGKQLVSVGVDNTIRIWQDLEGKQLPELKIKGYQDANNTSISSDGQLLATIDQNNTFHAWNLSKQKELEFPHLQFTNVSEISFNQDGNLLTISDIYGTIYLLDLENQKQSTTFQGNDIEFAQGSLIRQNYGIFSQGLSFSKDSNWLAIGGDNTITVFSRNGEQLVTFPEDSSPEEGNIVPNWVQATAFAPSGNILATGGIGGRVRLWNWRERKQILPNPIKAHITQTISVVFSPQGDLLATAGFDGSAGSTRLWDLSGKKLAEFKGAIKVIFSPDGKLLATASKEGTVCVWDLSGQALAQFKGFDRVEGISFSLDGNQLTTVGVVGYGMSQVKQWRIEDLDRLLVRGCNWVNDYLQNSPDVEESDRKLCDGILSGL